MSVETISPICALAFFPLGRSPKNYSLLCDCIIWPRVYCVHVSASSRCQPLVMQVYKYVMLCIDLKDCLRALLWHVCVHACVRACVHACVRVAVCLFFCVWRASRGPLCTMCIQLGVISRGLLGPLQLMTEYIMHHQVPAVSRAALVAWIVKKMTFYSQRIIHSWSTWCMTVVFIA